MPSKITGNYDIGIEISTRLIGRHLNDRLVGVHRFPGVAIRIAAVTASVDDAAAGEVRLRVAARISHGSITVPQFGILLRSLRLDVETLIAMKLELTPDGRGAQLRPLTDQLAITHQWVSEDARNAFYDPKLYQTPPSPEQEMPLFAVLRERLRQLLAQPFAIPGIDLGSAGLQLAALEARSLASRVVIGANLFPRANATLTSKQRSVLVDPGHVALTLSPELVRDGIVCPMLANVLGVAKNDLCAACGGAAATSLKARFNVDIERLDLTGIEVLCVPGALLLTLHMAAEAGSYDGAGVARFRVALDVHAGRLRARAQLEHVDLEIDSDAWSWFWSGGLSELVAEGVEAFAENLVRKHLGRPVEQSFELPTKLGNQEVRVERVVIDEDGVTVFGSSPGLPLARDPHTTVLHSAAVLRKEARGGGIGGATCVRSGYAYDLYDVDRSIRLEAGTANLAEPTTYRWTLSELGFVSGRELAIPVFASGHALSDDPAFVIVVPTLSADGRILTLQTRAADGNYRLDVRCIADDGLDVYGAYQSIEVQGRVAEFGPDYSEDLVHCANAKVLPLPKPPGGQRIPIGEEPGWLPPGPGPEIFGPLTVTRLRSTIDLVSRVLRERLRPITRRFAVHTTSLSSTDTTARRATRLG